MLCQRVLIDVFSSAVARIEKLSTEQTRREHWTGPEVRKATDLDFGSLTPKKTKKFELAIF